MSIFSGNSTRTATAFRDVRKLIKERNVRFVDLKFTDLPGRLRHFTIPVEHFDEDLTMDGVGFDGSSIEGFQTIEESDLILRPDLSTAFLDPFYEETTVSFVCNVIDPVSREVYRRDPRSVAQKAERFLTASGIADTAYFGPEAEFYIFDDVRYDQTYHEAFYHLDSEEGYWNTGRDEGPNLGYKPGYKAGYAPAPPMDSFHNLRSEMVRVMLETGIEAELHHHEVATGGQAEIDVKYGLLCDTADSMIKYKYVVKNVARAHDKTVTFMPKPLFRDNGTGMHVHQSIWKNERNLFYEPGDYADLSTMARHYVGGLIEHAPSLLAFCAPTTNSYRRLVPGYEAPVTLIYSQSNRSACVRIPMYSESEGAKRIEFRPPDPSCNPYLAFAAMMMAGLDGIIQEISPPEPIDKDLYDLAPEERAQVHSTPGSLEEALNALEKDHEYLTRGEVFTEDLIETWLRHKQEEEVEFVKQRPHPAEFALYYNI